MRTSQYLIATKKELPSDASIASHQLMLRAGFIDKVASGIYNWLPVGLKVLRKIEVIVREEMNRAGAHELLMPMVQPAELWQKSERWQKYGAELLRLKDRQNRDFCLGPTHEEIITTLASLSIKSYKQLPINLYQIQTKFRDEIRPRFGVMRAREFLMKDAYSFHLNAQSLDETYQIMQQTYCRIFDRVGLKYRVVMADSGAIGGDSSHEFHVLANSGEDTIAFSDTSDYAANIEQATTALQHNPKPASETIKTIDTPNARTISAVSELLGVNAEQTVKTLIVVGSQKNQLVALALRGDHTLNEIKTAKHPLIQSPLTFASSEQIQQILNCQQGSIGVVDLPITLLVDYGAYAITDFVCGANIDDKHFTGVNWQRDVKTFDLADLRQVVSGDPSPDNKGKIVIKQGIEVGHIFKLGNQYAKKLGAYVMSETGKAVPMEMGCYGIGISRVLAAAIEQNFDSRGPILPQNIAPFDVLIVPIAYHKSTRVRQMADTLYQQLSAVGIDVLLDDRKERPGIMFADGELIGINHRLVLNDGHVDSQTLEYQKRGLDDKQAIKFSEITTFIQKALKE